MLDKFLSAMNSSYREVQYCKIFLAFTYSQVCGEVQQRPTMLHQNKASVVIFSKGYFLCFEVSVTVTE